MRVTLVGPCASGKSVLARALQDRGYDARQCSQEHSYVPDMWRRICKPDVLIYLDAGLATIRRRRQISWGLSYLQVLNDRLRDARAHSDLVIRTDDMTPDEILQHVLRFLQHLERPAASSESNQG